MKNKTCDYGKQAFFIKPAGLTCLKDPVTKPNKTVLF